MSRLRARTASPPVLLPVVRVPVVRLPVAGLPVPGLPALLVVLLGALPLLAARPAPLQDWPNHVARIHVLIGLLRGDPFWSAHYRLVGFLVPGAALDLGVLGLTRIGLPVEAAAQLFLALTYLCFVVGFLACARALGASGPLKPAFATLLFDCNALFWGLVNYMLATGLMLGLLALWLDAARRPWRRIGLAAAGAAALLFAHVVVAVTWILLLGCFALFVSRAASVRDRIIGAASPAVALLVVGGLLHALPGGTGHDFSLHFAGSGPRGMVLRKLTLFARVLLGGSMAQDAASLAALLACVVAAWRARPRLAAAPAAAVAALVLLVLAAPERIGTGSVLDTRLAILPLLLLALALRLDPAPRAARWATAAVLARTLVLAACWHAAGTVFRDYRQRTATLPAGSVMMTAYGTPLPSLRWQQIWSPPLSSLATEVAMRDLFVPSLFANPAQQPIALRPADASLTQPWNLTDAAHLRASAAALAMVCAGQRFRGVYLTVLYPGGFLPRHAGAALLQARPNFLILDACRLPR